MDSDIPIISMRTDNEIVAESIVQLSFTMVVLGLAAVLAFILGTVGLYGRRSRVRTAARPLLRPLPRGA